MRKHAYAHKLLNVIFLFYGSVHIAVLLIFTQLCAWYHKQCILHIEVSTNRVFFLLPCAGGLMLLCAKEGNTTAVCENKGQGENTAQRP